MFLRAFHSVRFLLLKNARTDNFVFRLHYRWTSSILIALSLIVTLKLYCGYSFACFNSESVTSDYFTNALCYTESVFTEQKQLYDDIRGLRPKHRNDDVKKFYSYYSCVHLFLLLEAVLFYLPHLLWRSFEKDYFFKLTTGIDNIFIGEDRRNMELCLLAKYVVITQGNHKRIAWFYHLMEFGNYLVSLLQAVWVVHFFQVIRSPEIPHLKLKTWADFGSFYFPLKGKCEYEIQTSFDNKFSQVAVCLLPLQKLFMGIFVFLYSWYIFLTILSGSVLVYRLCLLMPGVRGKILSIGAPLCNRSILKSMCSRISYSDWFFLWRLRCNLSDVDFAQLVDKISVASRCSKLSENSEDGGKDTEHRCAISCM